MTHHKFKWVKLAITFKGAYLTNESPFKNDVKNVFYFTLKVLFVLKIFNFSLDFLVM